MGRQLGKRNHTPEERAKIVAEWRASTLPHKTDEICKKYDITRSTLYWFHSRMKNGTSLAPSTPFKLTKQDLQEIKSSFLSGSSKAYLAKKYKVTPATIHYHLDRYLKTDNLKAHLLPAQIIEMQKLHKQGIKNKELTKR